MPCVLVPLTYVGLPDDPWSRVQTISDPCVEQPPKVAYYYYFFLSKDFIRSQTDKPIVNKFTLPGPVSDESPGRFGFRLEIC